MPFKKGTSGNPHGRPKNPWRSHLTLADYKLALKTIRHLLEHGRSEKVRAEVAMYVVDQSIGRAVQAVTLDASVGVQIVRDNIPDNTEDAIVVQQTEIVALPPGVPLPIAAPADTETVSVP